MLTPISRYFYTSSFTTVVYIFKQRYVIIFNENGIIV